MSLRRDDRPALLESMALAVPTLLKAQVAGVNCHGSQRCCICVSTAYALRSFFTRKQLFKTSSKYVGRCLKFKATVKVKEAKTFERTGIENARC